MKPKKIILFITFIIFVFAIVVFIANNNSYDIYYNSINKDDTYLEMPGGGRLILPYNFLITDEDAYFRGKFREKYPLYLENTVRIISVVCMVICSLIIMLSLVKPIKNKFIPFIVSFIKRIYD